MMRVLIARLTMPYEPRNPYLDRWLLAREAEGHDVVELDAPRPQDVKRSDALARFAADPDGHDAILFIDGDMAPLDATKPILADDGNDVTWCESITQSGGRTHPGGCSAACLRVSHKAARAIKEPYFAFERDSENRTILMCECLWFARQAEVAGFKPVCVGRIGHRVTVVAYPTEDGGLGLVWPQQTGSVSSHTADDPAD